MGKLVSSRPGQALDHGHLRSDRGVPSSAPQPSQTHRDIIIVISEVVTVEQILIRNLPAGTKAALRARAQQRHRSVEAEARDVLAKSLEREPVTIIDLLSTDEGADIEFEPERLGLTARTAEL
jgi:plasmid stability protein